MVEELLEARIMCGHAWNRVLAPDERTAIYAHQPLSAAIAACPSLAVGLRNYNQIPSDEIAFWYLEPPK